jgi:large conductance mechanosensitive channel
MDNISNVKPAVHSTISIIGDFKRFAMRGNLIDMAVGFTVGAGFTTIAKSLVDDIIMPPMGLLIGRADFSDLFILLRAGEKLPPPYLNLAAARAAGAVTINYGAFINNLIAFLLVALAMFVIIRALNHLDAELEDRFVKEGLPPNEDAKKKCCYCLSTIPSRATKCACCTSELPEITGSKNK